MPNFPAIPEPQASVDSLYRSVMALKESVEVLTQQRGSRDNAAVTQGVMDEALLNAKAEAVLTAFNRALAEIGTTTTTLTATINSIVQTARNELELSIGSARAELSSAIYAEVTARAGRDVVVVRKIEELLAYTDAALASINEQLIVEVDEEGVPIASYILTLKAETDEAFAEVQNALTVTIDGAGVPLAEAVLTLRTETDDNIAVIEEHTESIGGIEVRYAVTGTINGVTGGFTFSGIQQIGGGATYDLEIDANVTINGNLLVNGSVLTTGLESHAVTNTWIASGSAVTNPVAGTVIHTITVSVSANNENGTLDIQFDAGANLNRTPAAGNNADQCTLAISIDNVEKYTRQFRCIVDVDGTGRIRWPMPMSYLATGLSAGSHDIDIYVKSNDINSGSGQREILDPYIRVTEFKR